MAMTTSHLYFQYSIIISTLLIAIILQCCCPCLVASIESLKLSSKSFNSLIYNAIHVAQDAKLQFAHLAVENSLHSMAIKDCVDLFDDSIDHLYSISSSTQTKAQGMKDSSASCSQDTNPCSSLSAIHANQETCKDGLGHHFMHLNNNDMKNESAFQAPINKLEQLLSKIVSIISTKTSNYSSTHINSRGPQVGNSWLGRQFDNNNYNDKLLANTSEEILVGNKVTVALDGSGDYESISAAIEATPNYSNQKFIILVKRGVYHEYIEIPKSKPNIVMIGDGIDVTIITGSRSRASGSANTFSTATFAIKGCGFIAMDITFENTAGPSGQQAVALLSKANNIVFYRCAFKGYQDTLYVRYGLQFFRECKVYGTVDFIFGDATAVFQNCEIIARKRMANQYNSVTAQRRELECSTTGFSFHQCIFTADGDSSSSSSIALAGATRTYLGRPWGEFSRVVVMKSSLGSSIDPLGWIPWNESKKGLDKVYYGEYMNYGDGSDVKGRVQWLGFHPYMSFDEANKFTVRNFIYGDKWLTSSGVQYDLDL